MNKANVLFQSQDWTNAAIAYEAIVQKDAANFQAWHRLGSARLHLRQYQFAAEACAKAVALNTQNPFAKYNLACAYARLNNREKAFAALSELAATGFFQPEQISEDEDLASLRADARFEKILAEARKSARPCSAAPEFRQFDFWIGEWEVRSHATQQPAGASSVQLILGECIIFENWTGVMGLNGKSFNLYNSATQKWRQTWVDDRGGLTEYVGDFKGDRMEFHAEKALPGGAAQLLRMTIFRLDDDHVRQLGEASDDHGKTWTVRFDLLYNRKDKAQNTSPGNK